MKRSLAAVLAVLASPLVLAAAPAPGSFSVTIEAKDFHEQCARLAKGEKRSYFWRADGPVDFNIHYHRGNDAFYPVKRDGMRGDGGSFTAKEPGDYCWMWTARDKPVQLEGRIQ